MKCQRCGNRRVVGINAKCNDLCYAELNGNEMDGYVPTDIGIGGGDYVDIIYCLDCGQLQGNWPLAQCELES